jgi:hypothetical protein
MKREDDQELWDLLGKAEQPTLSTWWMAPRWLVPAGAVAAAVVAATIAFDRPATQTPGSASAEMPLAVQLDPIDYQVVADLDVLLAMEEDNLWTDAEVSTL